MGPDLFIIALPVVLVGGVVGAIVHWAGHRKRAEKEVGGGYWQPRR